jgi:hypothetical protein
MLNIFLLYGSGTCDFGNARVRWRNEKRGGDIAETLILEHIGVDDDCRQKGVASSIITYMQCIANESGRHFICEDVMSSALVDWLERNNYVKIPGTATNLNVHSYVHKCVK